MGFRRAKFTQRNTNRQKNIFVDDRLQGHHPRALNRPVPSFVNVDPPQLIRCGRQDRIKVAVEVVERKEAKRRAKMKPAKIELQKVKKTWRFAQTKRGLLRNRGTLVHWNER